MKLPEKLVEFMHGPGMHFVGVRDAALQPEWGFSYGARVSADREHVTLYILETYAKVILENLMHNGQVALCNANFYHEAYQIKGEYTSSRPSEEHDYAIQEIFMDKVKSSPVFAMDPTGQLLARLDLILRRPTVAITFKVHEVFNQSPGPGSGCALDPNE